MKIQQETSGHQIIANGSTFTFESEPLIIEISLDPAIRAQVQIPGNLKIEINFINDPQEGKTIKGELVDNEESQFLKYSIYNADGIGATTSPLQIAENSDTHKKTFLSIGFQKTGSSILCTYTVFLEK